MRKIINESRSVWMPLAAIVIMSFIMILPQLITGSTIVGSDGLFHFNRIYDTAKQLSTGHWSYWQSNFGFQQSGRVVNAVYGPYFAYLMGASWLYCVVGTTSSSSPPLPFTSLVASGCTISPGWLGRSGGPR
ncbi:hypothetical protein [Lacticaseibacillus thailandensis]|uniref:hypothetical protein n=1 Tax=Lacticaseibacillus thailandensis TaxID=381741 RepID=UPI0006D28E30|nr:hypothetical protein [Lacticaseibacillus thailandensis]